MILTPKTLKIAINVLKYIVFFCVIIVGSISCSAIRPKLHKQILPVKYTGTLEIWDKTDPEGSNIAACTINSNPKINRRIISFWKQGHFESHFNKKHPFLSVKNQDILNLHSHLNSTFIIYHVQFKSNESTKISDLKSQVKKVVHCKPLTNLEIRFIMSSDSKVTFSKKPLTMVLLSAHELLLQKNAIPIYPTIYSLYLRKKKGLPALNSLEQMNLFANKKFESKNFSFGNGFTFCRKNP